MRDSYNYCAICGHTPSKADDEPNKSPVRFWDPDDGWKIATLCPHCIEDYAQQTPKPTDYAYETTNHVCDDCNTDEDPSEVFYQ